MGMLMRSRALTVSSLFFFNDAAPTVIYTLSLHDALPISQRGVQRAEPKAPASETAPGAHHARAAGGRRPRNSLDRKSTRLNSSHSQISYAVFCLKKKKETLMHSRVLKLGPLQRRDDACL